MFDLQSADEAYKAAKPMSDILGKNMRYVADKAAAEKIKREITRGRMSTVVSGPLSDEFIEYLKSPNMGYRISGPHECEDNNWWYNISWEPKVKNE